MTSEHCAHAPVPPPPVPWWMRPLVRALERLHTGELLLTAPDGQEYLFRGPQPGPMAELRVRRPRLLLRLALGGDLGLAKGWLADDWDSPDLAGVLELGARNDRTLGAFANASRPLRALRWLRHLARPNSLRGSRRNIEAHYDLGNDFYSRWLDPTMTYSAARFLRPDQPLAAAQAAKYDRLLELLDPEPGAHLLEIGCGWGGFAEHAARRGFRVTGITLSPRQLGYARARIRHAGLEDRVTLHLRDYRELRGTFDHVVSIEMFEAVGEAHWSAFFRVLRERLRPGGRAALQVITIADEVFPGYRRSADFIQLHIFPGGMLPAPAVFAERARAAGLRPARPEFAGDDYARTLARWERAFLGQREALASRGLDPRFLRLWHYYLAYCRAGFRSGRVDLMRTVLERPVD